MRIAIVSNGPGNYSTKRLKEEAILRGHEVEIIKYKNCYASIEKNNPEIKVGVSYTNEGSDLAVKVINIRYRSTEYIKIKGCLFCKRTGYVYETKNYKLMLKNITHWKRIEVSSN